ncbi:hypothetical protein BLS_003421 [Venturia inaequalis]|uniref:Zn(2)-C6 fungal-type domain-containing protein n=1 Tax=Venturia inaequalis TaxID=5025 RepID=A0A8H3YUA3_VENIN|nr:hypothetical protein BLS_003421 [Venturia inaequalis]
MFALTRIYNTLAGPRAGRDKTIHDFVDASSSDSSDDTDTDEDEDGIAERDSSPHSLHSSKYSDGDLPNDSGIASDDISRIQGGSVTRLSLEESPSTPHCVDAPEPFPDIDPVVLAIDIDDFDDPPNLQGLEIDNVEIYLRRLRDDPVFGNREACAGNATSSTEDDPDDALVHVLDTSVDFTSACVSRSISSTMTPKDLEHKDVCQASPKQDSKVLEDASRSLVEDLNKLSNTMALDDPFGPRYQLPDEKMQDYVKRVSARVEATLAKHATRKGFNSPASSSSSIKSRDEDFDTSLELSFNDIHTCPSSPPTPFTPRTPLNHRNLSNLSPPPTTNEAKEQALQPATKEWSPPPMNGPPIFNLTKTRLTPPHSEVYKHIDLTPLPLFHTRSLNPTRRYIILEQDCLQCSLKNLPCDDFHPTCKRCQRAGDAPYCLRQRRLASWELKQLGLERVGRWAEEKGT